MNDLQKYINADITVTAWINTTAEMLDVFGLEKVLENVRELHAERQPESATDCGCTDKETCIPHAQENLFKLFETSKTGGKAE